ncbi:hypothetical protein [Acetivibrio ethanolgignens]|uniref:hypothetical protein n=1 Tax=Acetivibrio ethanolgignens TaxID=290052 RepID=UPI0012DCB5DB|nr:hypothetical protein [Acetivibrio ethanolgignens]
MILQEQQENLRCYIFTFEVLVEIVVAFIAFCEGYSALSRLAVSGLEKGVLQDVLY